MATADTTTVVHGPCEKLMDVQAALEAGGWDVRSVSNGGPIGHVEVGGLGNEWVEYVSEQFGYYRNPDLDDKEWV